MADLTVFVQADPFAGQADEVAGYIPSEDDTQVQRDGKTGRSGGAQFAMAGVGRPLMGIQVKPNTAAFAQVVDKDGNARPLVNSLGGTVMDSEKVWTDWLLQTVREERVEKTQLLETFGETYLYAFGKKPQTLSFQGTLLNTVDFNWRATFWENWEQNFRATKLIEHKARMYISWDDILVEGYPINAVTHQIADNPNVMVFSFTFFVTRYISLAQRSDFSAQRTQQVPTAQFRTRETFPESDGDSMTLGQKIVAYSGLHGVNVGASAVAAGIRATVGQTNPLLASALAATAENAINFAGSLAANAALGDVSNLQNVLAVETARFAQATTQLLAYGVAEKTLGLSVVDTNMWFGYAAALANRAAVLAGHTSTSALLPTTMDDAISQMGYAIEKGIHPKPTAMAAPPDAPGSKLRTMWAPPSWVPSP